MPLSMSQLTVPAFVQALDAMAAVLDKASAYAAGKTIDEAVLLQARLFPDMYPMVRQVQIACDFAKGAVTRLADQPVPGFPDDETTFEALRARIAKTLDVVRSVPAAAIDGSEQRSVTIGTGDRAMTFKGEDYLLTFVLPNFYFHLATAYGLLRHAGVPVGKRDFVGAARLS